jgi:hypothetical protein
MLVDVAIEMQSEIELALGLRAAAGVQQLCRR